MPYIQKVKYLNVGTKWLSKQGIHTSHLETLTSRKSMWLFLIYSFICSTSPLTSSPLLLRLSSFLATPQISSVQFSCSVMYDSLWPHGPQNTRPPSPTPKVHPNPCPSSQWYYPTISFSVIPFSSCLQSFPASGSFQITQLFTLGDQRIGVSASTSVLPMNTQDWSPLGWTGWISLQSKGLSRVFPNTTVQKHQFFSAQLSSQSNSHIHTWPLEKPEPWLDGPLLAK